MTRYIITALSILSMFMHGTFAQSNAPEAIDSTLSTTATHRLSPTSDDGLPFYEKSKKGNGPVKRLANWCNSHNVANNLDAAFSIGTDGFGFELATPITKWTTLRVGLDWTPSFHIPLDFDVTTFSDGEPSNNISEVQKMVYDLTGMEIDNQVRMICKPNFLNFKLLVDVFPFQENRHWHFTAGFYIGNRTVAKAIDAKEEMPTLVGLNIYNRGYEYFTTLEDIYDVHFGGSNYIDPAEVVKLQDKFRQYGRIGIHIGDFKNGTPYFMEPDSDGTVRANALANIFKPYLGFGYSGHLDQKKKWSIGLEAGAMFWGGAPDVIVHDGVNLTKDVVNIPGTVGNYMKFIRALPVFPVINCRISYSFF